MSWAKLLADHRVTALPPSVKELEDLRSIVTSSLKDVMSPDLSDDARFVMAYDAARTLSLMVVRAAGYRPRAVGGHYNTFLALEAVDKVFAPVSAYFDGCRIKRNECEYDFAGGISETDADGSLQATRKFGVTVEEWLRNRHPDLAQAETRNSEVNASQENSRE